MAENLAQGGKVGGIPERPRLIDGAILRSTENDDD